MNRKFLMLCLCILPMQGFGAYDLTELKNRTNAELRTFTEITSMASNFKGLAPASPLGIWGFNAGVELTTLPHLALQVTDEDIELPKAFPRISVAKGLTPNFDIALSGMTAKIFPSELELPQELSNLFVYGGGLKYTVLREGIFPVSVGVRATYNRLKLPFFKSDTYGADVSLSRSLFLFPKVSVTPFAGVGYVSIHGEFNPTELSKYLQVSSKQAISDYRYFSGVSFNLFFLNMTGQFDFGNPKEANTISIKAGLQF